MKHIFPRTLFLVACAFAQACDTGEYPGVMPAEDVDSSSLALTLELDAKFNDYAQALLDNDIETLNGTMSSEIRMRTADMGSNMRGFARKLRSSMLRQFPEIEEGSDILGRFTVEEVREEGDAIRVEVAFDGVELPKPFYFVLEDGEYRLNLLQPGFTNALPRGFGGATRSYLVHNNNPLNPSSGVSINCNGGILFVPPGGERSISCSNTCGWFQGSTFWAYSSATGAKCDYNTWGVDVFIDDNRSNGFYCNDKC